MKFRATVELGGKTATGIEVPSDIVEALAAGKRPAVTVQVGDHTYRTTVTPMAGKFYVPLSAENRGAAGVEAGDDVDVEIDPDTEPRVMDAPDDLAQALALDPPAEQFFDTLSYSHRRAYVDWITSAKKPQTRERRIGQAVEMLADGRKR